MVRRIAAKWVGLMAALSTENPQQTTCAVRHGAEWCRDLPLECHEIGDRAHTGDTKDKYSKAKKHRSPYQWTDLHRTLVPHEGGQILWLDLGVMH